MTIVNPGPWVDYEAVEAEVWKSQLGIIKLIEFPVRNPKMSRRAFHLYWQKHHSPHVMNLTSFAQFIRKYNSGHAQNRPLEQLPDRYIQETSYEGASELWLDGLEELEKWFGQPIYEDLIHHDEQRFLSQEGEGAFMLTREERLYEPDIDMDENLKTKVYLLLKGKAESSYQSLHAGASEHGRLILAQPTLKAYLRKVAISHALIPPHPEGIELSDVDVVFEFWFDDVESAEQFFQQEDYRTVIMDHESSCFDVSLAKIVAEKMRVVHDEFSFQPSVTQPLPFNL